MVRLDIFSDPVCPWCYIGKAMLERALEQCPDHPFAVEWHPFQLNPNMAAAGEDRRAYLEAKFGSKINAARAYSQVEKAAEAAGVAIDFEKMPRMPNTLNAHRLIHWAGLEGRQTAAMSGLFRAYFRDGRDIGDLATLAGIGGEIGMDRAVVARLLASDADLEPIRLREAHARARGVNAVPTFIIADQHALQGAQPTELWGRVIDDVNRQLAGAASGTASGAASGASE